MEYRFPRPNSRAFALHIINTFKLPDALSDVLYLLLLDVSWGIKPDDIFILIDSSSSDSRFNLVKSIVGKNNVLTCFSQGGRSNFVNCYTEILSKIQSISNGGSSSLFISISGHGTQIKDDTGDEPTGFDDAILPGGVIVRDDDLKKGLEVVGSNFNVLTASDTCHSGTMFDFEYECNDDLSEGERCNYSKGNLKFEGLSLSACTDNQVDYEVGAKPSLVGKYIPRLNLNSSQVGTYINHLQKYTTTGALTAHLIDTCLERVTLSSIKTLRDSLKSLGQSCEVCKTTLLKNRDGSVTLTDFRNSKLSSATSRETIQDDVSLPRSGSSDDSSSSGGGGGGNTSLWWILGVLGVILLLGLIFAAVYKYYTSSKVFSGGVYPQKKVMIKV